MTAVRFLLRYHQRARPEVPVPPSARAPSFGAVPSLRSQNDGEVEAPVIVSSGAVDSVSVGEVSVGFVLVMLVTFGKLMLQKAKIPKTGLSWDWNILVWSVAGSVSAGT